MQDLTWGPKGNADGPVRLCHLVLWYQHPARPTGKWLHLTCSVAQVANVFQRTWHKRPRAEASLGNTRGPSPVCVCECAGGGDTIWHKTPETSRMNDSGSPLLTIIDTALSQEESNLGELEK